MTDEEITQKYCEASKKATTAKLKIFSLRVELATAEDDMDNFWTMWRMRHVCDCSLTKSGSGCEHDKN